METLTLFLLGLVVAAMVTTMARGLRWPRWTRALERDLDAGRAPGARATYRERDLDGLPAPVQRFFRVALRDGQRVVVAARIGHRGAFNMSADGEQWKPFSSAQRVVVHRPGFVWDARIMVAPGIPVHVHDACVAGRGVLRASLLGAITVARQPSTPELARGELMRWLAEAAWYPTALLPGAGVSWEPIDDGSARATVRDGDLAATLAFRFGADGLIESVRADARGRTVDRETVPTPWEGRWTNYQVRDGMRIPMDGEVAWILPGGRRPYWRGRVTSVSFEFAP